MLKSYFFRWMLCSIFLLTITSVQAISRYSSIKHLQGIVIDYNTGKPLANTKITIQGSSVEEAFQVYTNESGFFEAEISAGIYQIHIKNPRYYTEEMFKSIPFDEETEIQMTISMQRIVVGQVVAIKGIRFNLNSLRFEVHSQEWDNLLHLLRSNPNLILEISCHTDSRGDDEYNLKLSQNRAESLTSNLVSKGINQQQLTARGYGETFPLNHCTNSVRCSSREHQQNRRVEYAVVGFIDNKHE